MFCPDTAQIKIKWPACKKFNKTGSYKTRSLSSLELIAFA